MVCSVIQRRELLRSGSVLDAAAVGILGTAGTSAASEGTEYEVIEGFEHGDLSRFYGGAVDEYDVVAEPVRSGRSALTPHAVADKELVARPKRFHTPKAGDGQDGEKRRSVRRFPRQERKGEEELLMKRNRQ